MTKQGPTLIKVPTGVTYNTCFDCRYLNRVMVRSGRNPVHSNNCTHDYDNEVKGPGPYPAEIRFISQETPPITPHWCPILAGGS
jgi:hypothetical protein